MPDTLDDLSQQYINPQLWNLPEQSPDQRQMTHYPEPENPVPGMLGTARSAIGTASDYWQKGLSANPTIQNWLNQIPGSQTLQGLLQSQTARDAFGTANTFIPPALLGMGIRAAPIAGRPGSYDIFGPNDERLGWIIPKYDPVKKQVYVGYYGSYGDPNLPAGSKALALNKAPWSFGNTPMEALKNQLDMLQLAKDEFPEATTVLGGRATGATRGKPSRPKPLPEQTTYEKTPKTPEFLELERELGRIARESIAEHGRSPPGSLNLTPTQSPLRTPPLPRDPNDIENLLRLIFNPNR